MVIVDMIDIVSKIISVGDAIYTQANKAKANNQISDALSERVSKITRTIKGLENVQDNENYRNALEEMLKVFNECLEFVNEFIVIPNSRVSKIKGQVNKFVNAASYKDKLKKLNVDIDNAESALTLAINAQQIIDRKNDRKEKKIRRATKDFNLSKAKRENATLAKKIDSIQYHLTHLEKRIAKVSPEDVKKEKKEKVDGLIKEYCEVYKAALAGEDEDNFSAGQRTAVKHLGLAILGVVRERSDIEIFPVGRDYSENTVSNVTLKDLSKDNFNWSKLHGLILKQSTTGNQIYVDLGYTHSADLTIVDKQLSEIANDPSFLSSSALGSKIINAAKTNLKEDAIHVNSCPEFQEKYLDSAKLIATNSSKETAFTPEGDLQSHDENALAVRARTGWYQHMLLRPPSFENQNNKLTTEKIAWFPIPADIKFALEVSPKEVKSHPTPHL